MSSTESGADKVSAARFDRRKALVVMGAAVTAAAASRAEAAGVPWVPFGRHRVSRLIVGGNPVSANSHVSRELNAEMMDYFTADNTKAMLQRCEAAGINTWQSRGDRHIMRLLHEYRQDGGTIQWIAQTASEMADQRGNIERIADSGPVGIYHHGSLTDKLWKAGRIDEVKERLKLIRDLGIQAGLGTHIPEVIDYVESRNWDLDFYMTCIYNLGRTPEEARQVAGKPVEGELFWDPDRERMLDRVKQTRRTCLIFKVYGATRHCSSEADMQGALDLVSDYAKPNDCIVIGMFPKYTEQVTQNCRLFREAFKA